MTWTITRQIRSDVRKIQLFHLISKHMHVGRHKASSINTTAIVKHDGGTMILWECSSIHGRREKKRGKKQRNPEGKAFPATSQPKWKKTSKRENNHVNMLFKILFLCF